MVFNLEPETIDFDEINIDKDGQIDYGPLDFTDVNYNHEYDDYYPDWYNQNSNFIDEINEKLNYMSNRNHIKIKVGTLNNDIYKVFKFKSKSELKFKSVNQENQQVTRCDSYRFYPTEEQKLILNGWFKECIKLYNECVKINNDDSNYFKKGHISVKLDVFKRVYGDDDKPCPYDSLTDVVREFCSNKKSAESNLKAGNIRKYEIKKKIDPICYSMMVPKTAVKIKEDKKGDINGYVYQRSLGPLKGLENLPKKVTHDCRIFYDKIKNIYFLKVPKDVTRDAFVKDNNDPIVAVDPGEKVFIAFHSANKFGYLGKDIREKILIEEAKIRRFQRVLSRKKNRKGDKIRKSSIIKKIRKVYRRINNIVKDLHNKSALYLCKNYKKILLPEFGTQNMVRDKKDKTFVLKDHLNELKEKEGEKKMKEELRRITKKRRLNGRVKFCLSQLSHYKFRQHLLTKSEEYGCEVKIVTEEYTSQACTKCMAISKYFNKREKECTECDYKSNRDLNGARNIYLKNLSKGDIKK